VRPGQDARKGLKQMENVRTAAIATEMEDVIRQVVERFHPHKVILFGSYAYGQPHEWSDVDLLVVTPDPPPRKERWKAVYGLEGQTSLPLQIVFMSPEEFEETRDVVGGIAYPAHQWGKVVYEPNP